MTAPSHHPILGAGLATSLGGRICHLTETDELLPTLHSKIPEGELCAPLGTSDSNTHKGKRRSVGREEVDKGHILLAVRFLSLSASCWHS